MSLKAVTEKSMAFSSPSSWLLAAVYRRPRLSAPHGSRRVRRPSHRLPFHLVADVSVASGNVRPPQLAAVFISDQACDVADWHFSDLTRLRLESEIPEEADIADPLTDNNLDRSLPRSSPRKAGLQKGTRRANHLGDFSTPLSSRSRKNILIFRNRKSLHIFDVPALQGAFRGRHGRWVRDAVDVDVPLTNGTDADGEVVWS
jgi:hypothetical protein